MAIVMKSDVYSGNPVVSDLADAGLGWRGWSVHGLDAREKCRQVDG